MGLTHRYVYMVLLLVLKLSFSAKAILLLDDQSLDPVLTTPDILIIKPQNS